MGSIYRIILNFLFKLFKSEFLGFEFLKSIKLHDKNWKIPIINGVGQSHLLFHEDYLVNHYRKIIKNSDTFIDIGANLGQTILKIKSISNKINYIAFEPSVVCVNYIQSLILHNRIDNIELFPVGLYSSNDVLSFYINSGHSQGNSIIEGIRRGSTKTKVNIPVFKLDYFLDHLVLKGKIVIKIDVEGAEHFVLRGMTEMIKLHRPIFVIEFLRIPIHDTDYVDETSRLKRLMNQEYCEEFFLRNSYDKYCLTTNGSLEFIDVIGFNEDESRTNYIVFPTELNIDIYPI